jgi:ribonuclease BN (tRNA processing enzyme)
MDKLIFLGTGSGDIGMLKQSIKTSSLYFEIDGIKFIMDPGPGTIVNAKENKIDLLELDGLIVTHPHPDHYADANCLIDALRKEDTFLIAGKKCLVESERYYPCINKFQQTIPEKTFNVNHGSKVEIKDVTFEAIKNNHLDCGLGIKIIGSRKIGYVGDGTLKGLEEFYKSMDILIFNVLIPHEKPAISGVHTSIDEIIEFLKITKPKQAIIQHFSEEMINAGIDKQAKIIQDASKVKTTAAKDGMIFSF